MKTRVAFGGMLAAMTAFLVSASSPALAHDSWFARLGAVGGGVPLLALGTGNRFPVLEFAIDPKFLARDGCRSMDGTTRQMQTVRVSSTALVLRPGQPGATTCWAQLEPFDVELEADKVDLYLDEINATPAVRTAWATMRARGAPWRERYTKHSRIELQPGPDVREPAAPGDMALDVRRVAGPAPGLSRVGDQLVFELHRDGRALAGMPVEVRHRTGSPSLWRETDVQGRVAVQPAVAGDWLLRGVDLRLSRSQPDAWESDFITLAFTVEPQQPTRGSEPGVAPGR